MKKYLLAVSGGPDSMFMLDWYKKKNIVVAHVNYHKREDSDHDERIVREFCAKYSIQLEVFNVSEKHSGNFQDWARKIRYDFFKEVYTKHSCDVLLIAHQKDDFLETAWMQMNAGRQPKYFGIQKKATLNGMNIYRPFIDLYWKHQIIEHLNKNKIEFATDYTNAQPIYQRNKVRLELDGLPKKEKQNRYEWFVMSNKILKKKNARVRRHLLKWEKTSYSLDFFRNLKSYQEEILFDLIHSSFEDNKVSSSKLEGLIQFIKGKEGAKKYYISEHEWFMKEKGLLKKGRD